MTIKFLGTGTSTGVPQIDCNCPVCRSSDWHDKRLRTSAIISLCGVNILIDCGPDFRQQIINAGVPRIDAVLLTHSHYDHVGGLDELRSITSHYDLPIYCKSDVKHDIMTRLPYCFREHLYPGVAKLNLNEISDSDIFVVNGISVTPLLVLHYQLPILGFRIGDFAYITDAKTIPQSTMEKLYGIKTLIINSLRIEPHFSHMCLDESLDVISKIKPDISYLIHMNHGIGFHHQMEAKLPEGVKLAYDGLEVERTIKF
ncbi:MAG: MBL fold metallo-hydrolase [Muribaculaceae bacterium]|nr:MBL fold metallo-hydrolase [Muribaculaceae bacterium]